MLRLVYHKNVYLGPWLETYANKEQHPVHCAFRLIKLHEALMNHLLLDNQMMSFENTIHRGKVLMQD